MTIEIKEKVPLAPYTTFKIGGPARFYCVVDTEDALIEACDFALNKKIKIFILGGGSNILMSDNGFDGLVIKIGIQGIEEIKNTKLQDNIYARTNNNVTVSVGAGEQWDTFVEYTVSQNLYGLENLSAIPGTVGAAPVQNIGAYGTEVSQSILKVRAFDTHTMQFVEFTSEQCQFSYRNSLFKKEKGRYVITKVDFQLFKDGAVNIGYKDVKDYFAEKQTANPTLVEVREAIIDIRWNKLPDWKLWGTAGSFFKNPIISAEYYEKIKKTYPDLPGYPDDDGMIKVSLGWILDKACEMKGLCIGNACVYEKQALILVTKPGATSEEVVKLAHNIMIMVKEKTGIDIEGEVEWVN